ncbi:MAG: LamG-like jellyroll fold domain-containing protein, partial [Gammaproteobacteria bacterium]
HAYWTGAADANGTLNAFTVKARDDDGALSSSAVQASISVTAVNDDPAVSPGVGRVAVFDGSGDHVRVADHASLDGFSATTIEAWVYLESNAATTYIASKWDGFVGGGTAWAFGVRSAANGGELFFTGSNGVGTAAVVSTTSLST